jgi:hypothetical protein
MKRSELIPYLLSFLLSSILLISALAGLYTGQWFNAFLAMLALVLTYFPAFLERNLKVILPLEIEMLLVMFVFSAMYLGEIRSYYTTFWWWDLFLHTSSGFLLGLLGFIVIYVLNSQDRVRMRLSPLLVGVFSFVFSVALGAIWEIFEFSIDFFLGMNMQKSGLNDTMGDMIVNLIGGLVMACLGALYVHQGKTHFIDGILKKFVKKNPHLFSLNQRKP